MMLNPANMGPRHLISAKRQLKHTIRERGLQGYGEDVQGVDMGVRFGFLRAKVDKGQSFSPREMGQLRSVVAWCAKGGGGNGRTFVGVSGDDAVDLVSSVLADHGKASSSLWWTLVQHLWRTDRLEWLHSVRPALPPRFTKRHAGIGNAVPTSGIANHMTRTLIAVPSPLPKALELLRIRSETLLGAAVLEQALSVSNISWLRQQPVEAIDSFLEAHTNSRWVGRMGGVLLSPFIKLNIGPGDVQRGSLGDLIGRIEPHLPRSEAASAWVELGEHGRQMIKWYRIQRDIEDFFRKWNAEPERAGFWRGYIGAIKDVQGFERGGALAMRIEDVWFVEVGKTKFATWAIAIDPRGHVNRWGRPTLPWASVSKHLAKARSSEGLRTLCLNNMLEKNIHPHTDDSPPRWWGKYERWLHKLTGALKDGATAPPRDPYARKQRTHSSWYGRY